MPQTYACLSRVNHSGARRPVGIIKRYIFLEGASPLLRTIDTDGKENCVYPTENKCSSKPPKSESRCVSQGHIDEIFRSVLTLSLKKLKHVSIKIVI